MDIIQGFIETGNAGKSGWRIMNNKGTLGVVNKRTSNVSYSILNSGTIAAGSNFINSYSTTPAPTSAITSSPAATTTGTTGAYTYQVFTYTTETAGAGTGQSLYTINVPTGGMVCDVLVVGGGGGGGTFIGGGGGGGGVLYIQNASISAGTYNIFVGNGGNRLSGSAVPTIANNNGKSSKAFGIEVFGGGYGGSGMWAYPPNYIANNGANGGSGGAGGSYNSGRATTVGGNSILPSYTNNVLVNGTYTYYGGSGGDGKVIGFQGGGSGGGGAGGIKPTSALSSYDGADGAAINITGVNYFWGGGGGGCIQDNLKAGNGGKGGGGGGSGGNYAGDSVGIGGIGGITLGQDGDLNGDGIPTAGDGGAGTGGGGGATASVETSPLPVSGAGGSGIVIIRYLTSTASASSSISLIQEPNLNIITNYVGSSSSSGSSQWTTVAAGAGSKIYYNAGNVGVGTIDPIAPLHIYNTSNARLLLDTATTGTATLEFRRGTGADAQNDYRFINDTNSTLKLQIENTTQSFGNTIADLAWFSSNDTIIHKNTTFNGRVGIGTAYHTTAPSRTLDIVGDANISGVLSAGSFSATSATITNSITSNTSLNITNGFVATLPNEIVVAGTTFGTIGADRFISFPYTGTAATKDYSFTTTEALNCDILVVGGGGAGGTRVSGGGGAGALIYITNQTLTTGTYTIKVGRGGIGAFQIINNVENPGETGKDSEIFNNSGSVIYRAKGGGGGSSLGSYTATFTPQGGSSGGYGPEFTNGANNYIRSGISPVSTNVLTINENTTTIAPNNTSVYGYAGGGGYIFGGRYMAGGGGGAGGVGQSINTTAFTKAGDGGSAISISITGSAVAYAGGGGAGGGRVVANSFTEPGTGGSINGTRVGGIGGYLKAATTFNGIAYPAEGVGGDAVANTGSGGGGAGVDDIAQSASVYRGGAGGSGIVIIRYRRIANQSAALELTASSSIPIIEPQTFNFESIYPPYRYFTYNDTNGVYTILNGSIEASDSTNFSYTYSYNDTANTQGNNEQTSSTFKNTYGMGLYKFSVGGTQTAGGRTSGIFIYGLSSDYSISTSGNRPAVNHDDNAALPNGAGWYVGTGWTNATTYNSSFYYNPTFAGAWIKIEMPVGIVFSSFRILRGPQNRAPKAFKIYGSNTNTTTAADWTLLHTETNYTYNAGGDFGVKQSVTNNLIFKNYLMVVNEITAFDGGLLVFQGWYIYGKEQLTSAIINSDYKYLSFTHSGGTETQTSYTVNFPESTLCDILVVGGGGGGGYSYSAGGGGGGGYVYLQNISVSSGNYTINVGSGGTAGVNGASPAGWGGNGANSSITGAINYIALGGGGGAGGSAFNYPTPITGIGSNGGSGGGGTFPATTGFPAGGTSTQLSTYGYGNGGNGNPYTSQIGGGGGGASGIVKGSGTGNDGLSNSITGSSITYSGGGGGGNDFATIYQGGSGGGGAGSNGSGTNVPPVAGTNGLGGGGGGARGGGTGNGAKGGSGIVIIRYKTTKIGNQTYKVGNYSGEFKVISSVSNTDTEYIRITAAGAITNPMGTASWNIGSDRRIKENIERASYDKCYDNINKLELNRFNYVAGFNTVNRDKTQLGFIAQEVSAIFPKSISTQEYYTNTLSIPNLMSIDISQINYSLYGAVKKLIEINEEKETRIITLKNRIKKLKNLLTNTYEDTTSNIIIIEETTSNIVADTVVMDMISSNIAADTIVIEETTSNITADTIILDETTSNIAADTIVMDMISSNITADTIILDETTSNITADTIILDETTSNIAADAIVMDMISSNIAADTVVIDTISSNIVADVIVIDTISSNITTDTIILNETSSNITTDTIILNETSSNITADTIILNETTSNIATDTIILNETSSNIATDTIILNETTSNIATDTIILNETTSNITTDTIILNETTSNITADTIILDASSSNIPADTIILNETTRNITADTIVIEETTSNITTNQ